MPKNRSGADPSCSSWHHHAVGLKMEGSEPLDEPEELSENDWNLHRDTQGSNLIGATPRVCADRFYEF